MSKSHLRLKTCLTLSLLGTGLLFWNSAVAKDEPIADDPALARTRKQVQMLDDLYKTAIVIVTENYVKDAEGLAAGDAFQALFKTMKDKGYHEVRLVDATGEPYDSDNAPRDEFETAAVESLKSGQEGWYEQVVEANGQRQLRVATAIPVVMEKCIMCHEHYADIPRGQAIGALSYTIAIE